MKKEITIDDIKVTKCMPSIPGDDKCSITFEYGDFSYKELISDDQESFNKACDNAIKEFNARLYLKNYNREEALLEQYSLYKSLYENLVKENAFFLRNRAKYKVMSMWNETYYTTYIETEEELLENIKFCNENGIQYQIKKFTYKDIDIENIGEMKWQYLKSSKYIEAIPM